VQAIESELIKLSREQMRQVRDWLDGFLNAGTSDGPQEFSRSGKHSQEKLTERDLRAAVSAGVRQVRSGRVKPFDEATLNRIKARGRELVASVH